MMTIVLCYEPWWSPAQKVCHEVQGGSKACDQKPVKSQLQSDTLDAVGDT